MSDRRVTLKSQMGRGHSKVEPRGQRAQDRETKSDRPSLEEQLRLYRERRRAYDAKRGKVATGDGYQLHRGVRRDYRV